MVLRAHISYVNRFAQLTTETDKNDARHVLSQLSEKLSFSDIHQTTIKTRSVCNLESALIKLNLKELIYIIPQMKYFELILIF